eukprot:960368-Pleurochrysis_carterae.AAC.1
MRRVIGKCSKFMNGINNSEGVEQASKALRIIPEWRETDMKRKKGVIALIGSWTGEMMNWARIIQMKTWIIVKNEHKASVQRRWDNKGIMNKAFQRWRKR